MFRDENKHRYELATVTTELYPVLEVKGEPVLNNVKTRLTNAWTTTALCTP